VCDSIYLKLGDHMNVRNINNLFVIQYYTLIKVVICHDDLTSTFIQQKKTVSLYLSKIKSWSPQTIH
jgi:hypothetical protein